MADIFFSYAKVDRDRVKPLIEALEAEPWNVWWDNDLTVGGSWSEEIKTELYSAPCAVVAWTNSSIKSEFVQDEARRAHEGQASSSRSCSIPSRVADGLCGGVQTADFTTWNGDRQSIEFIRLRGAIQKKLTGAASTEPATVPPLH
ncbi:toll/interleukin-1 receptor domain-containing protein [Bradyrhizobium betae]